MKLDDIDDNDAEWLAAWADIDFMGGANMMRAEEPKPILRDSISHSSTAAATSETKLGGAFENKGYTLIKILVVLAIAAILLAIAIPVGITLWSMSLNQGRVIDRSYHAAWTDVQYIKIPNGPYTIEVPQQINYPESWYITIEGNDPKGVHKRRTLKVDQLTFREVKVGDSYSVDGQIIVENSK